MLQINEEEWTASFFKGLHWTSWQVTIWKVLMCSWCKWILPPCDWPFLLSGPLQTAWLGIPSRWFDVHKYATAMEHSKGKNNTTEGDPGAVGKETQNRCRLQQIYQKYTVLPLISVRHPHQRTLQWNWTKASDSISGSKERSSQSISSCAM